MKVTFVSPLLLNNKDRCILVSCCLTAATLKLISRMVGPRTVFVNKADFVAWHESSVDVSLLMQAAPLNLSGAFDKESSWILFYFQYLSGKLNIFTPHVSLLVQLNTSTTPLFMACKAKHQFQRSWTKVKIIRSLHRYICPALREHLFWLFHIQIVRLSSLDCFVCVSLTCTDVSNKNIAVVWTSHSIQLSTYYHGSLAHFDIVIIFVQIQLK